MATDPTGWPFPPKPAPQPAAVPQEPIDPMGPNNEDDGEENEQGD